MRKKVRDTKKKGKRQKKNEALKMNKDNFLGAVK
jgi:hypothetical protein